MEKGWEQIVAALGVLLTGAAYVPIDVAQPPARATDARKGGVRRLLTQSWLTTQEWAVGSSPLAFERRAQPTSSPTSSSPRARPVPRRA